MESGFRAVRRCLVDFGFIGGRSQVKDHLVNNQQRLQADDLPKEIQTPRLLLRRWREDDQTAFAEMNADPRVMEHFPGLLSVEDSKAMVERIQSQFDEHGFGVWAVEIPGVVPFAGFVGLMIPRFDAHFTPCIEIGWRLIAKVWGNGYAPEGAHAALDFAFDQLNADEVISMTAVSNLKSRRVMEKIGMSHSPDDDFDHPLVPEDHRLCRHVLYRLKLEDRVKRSNG